MQNPFDNRYCFDNGVVRSSFYHRNSGKEGALLLLGLVESALHKALHRDCADDPGGTFVLLVQKLAGFETFSMPICGHLDPKDGELAAETRKKWGPSSITAPLLLVFCHLHHHARIRQLLAAAVVSEPCSFVVVPVVGELMALAEVKGLQR